MVPHPPTPPIFHLSLHPSYPKVIALLYAYSTFTGKIPARRTLQTGPLVTIDFYKFFNFYKIIKINSIFLPSALTQGKDKPIITSTSLCKKETASTEKSKRAKAFQGGDAQTVSVPRIPRGEVLSRAFRLNPSAVGLNGCPRYRTKRYGSCPNHSRFPVFTKWAFGLSGWYRGANLSSLFRMKVLFFFALSLSNLNTTLTLTTTCPHGPRITGG